MKGEYLCIVVDIQLIQFIQIMVVEIMTKLVITGGEYL
jgi:hypothetical protein